MIVDYSKQSRLTTTRELQRFKTLNSGEYDVTDNKEQDFLLTFSFLKEQFRESTAKTQNVDNLQNTPCNRLARQAKASHKKFRVRKPRIHMHYVLHRT